MVTPIVGHMGVSARGPAHMADSGFDERSGEARRWSPDPAGWGTQSHSTDVIWGMLGKYHENRASNAAADQRNLSDQSRTGLGWHSLTTWRV